jgi:XTP/dITP diphosphohydrolase
LERTTPLPLPLRQLVAASNNAHKLAEIRPLLAPGVRILSLQDIGCQEELPETTSTLEGNSLQKARYVFDHYGYACFADDTGLEVLALNGAPGVDSAHYAGPQRSAADNMALLLNNLEGQLHRGARFRTVITLVDEQGVVHTFEGIVEGEITTHKMGSDGFGYDPVFRPVGFDRTFAQMTMEEKNMVSHRGRAVGKLVDFLKAGG